MKLIRPYTKIIFITPDALGLIETAGRTCYKSEGLITEESSKKFVKLLIKRGHESVIEHAVATVKIVCDRGVTYEIVRHRIASYSQESTRYCDYQSDHVTFIIPPWVKDIDPGIYNDQLRSEDETANAWFNAVWLSEGIYKELRELGWKPEQARSVLPNSLKTEIIMTANLREWRHFFKLRTSKAAHPQMREVANSLLLQMRDRVPVVFEDLSE